MAVTILSLNVRGLADTFKRRAIFNFYHERADVICLQETPSVTENEVIWKAEWGGDILFSHGTNKARGTCVLPPKAMKENITSLKSNQLHHMICFDVSLHGLSLTIATIYAPNNDHPSFFGEVASILTAAIENIVIIGDFNLTIKPELDRIGSVVSKPKSLHLIKDMMWTYNLNDVWRNKNPDARCFSWYRHKPKLSAGRIDFSLVSVGLVN